MPRLPAADLASGVTAAFGICAALLGRASSGLGAYLDVSMTDVMSTWTGRTGATADSAEAYASETQAVPGYGLFATADDRQISLGVVNEQHFWTRLCQELGLDEWADLDFDTRNGRGGELQKEVAAAIAGRERDDLVAALTDAGVPVAPVLDRREMVASAPFPPFPIRLGLPEGPGTVPALDEHHGQGFQT
jgi:crotonobetainyl-CoA:carnitine CoA-transferase CaiB-like acyl-CoA transferase